MAPHQGLLGIALVNTARRHAGRLDAAILCLAAALATLMAAHFAIAFVRGLI